MFVFLFRGSIAALVLPPLLLLVNILQVAHIKAQQEKFDEAQQIYEEVATRMAEKWVPAEQSTLSTLCVGEKHCLARWRMGARSHDSITSLAANC